MEDRQHSALSVVVISRALLPLLGIVLPVAAVAQVPRSLIEQALDQPVEQLEIVDTPIRDALAKVEQRTGLHFVLAEGVLDLMPYGERTLLTIRIREMPVRTALTRVLEGLGLAMFVEQGGVVIAPGPVLERVERPLTIGEIRLLSRLAAEKWSVLQRGDDKLALDFRIDFEGQPRQTLERTLAQIDAPNALRQLEGACETLHWVWQPEAERLVFRRMRDEIRRRLEWPIDLMYQREPLDRLLVDLGARVGVLIKFEPGALQKVQARDRAVDLIQRGGTVRQAFERICGNTGLRYEIDDEGVQIRAPLGPTDQPEAGNIEQWIRIELEIRPGVKMDVFMRQDQLPASFREEAERKLKEILRG